MPAVCQLAFCFVAACCSVHAQNTTPFCSQLKIASVLIYVAVGCVELVELVDLMRWL
jgi:hypothetical protein